MARALEYLRTLPPKKTYVVGLQNMVFAEARDKKDLPLIQRNADWLIDKGIGWHQCESKAVAGELEGWSYPGNTDRGQLQHAIRPARPLRRQAGRREDRRQRLEGDPGLLQPHSDDADRDHRALELPQRRQLRQRRQLHA